MDLPFSFPSTHGAASLWLRSRLLVSLLLLGLLTGPAQAMAGNLYSYGLDSLVFMSEHILRGQLRTTQSEDGQELSTLTVTATWKGSTQPGDSLQIGDLSLYKIPGPTAFSQRHQVGAGEGDEVIAFLIRPSMNVTSGDPNVKGHYVSIPSGIKVIQKGRALSFRQFMNPGPYELNFSEDPGLRPEVSELERECRELIPTLRPVQERLSRPAEKADLPWLLDLLRSRSEVKTNLFDRRDAIAEAVCVKLAENKDLPALDEALQVTKSWHGLKELHRGFIAQEARTHLLNRLLDPALTSPETRALYSHALQHAAWDYHKSSAETEAFYVPLARLIVDFDRQGDVATSLLLIRYLHAPITSPPITHLTNAEQDRIAALKILNTAYPQVLTPRLRFQVDRLALTTPEAFDFAPALGPMVTLVTLSAPDSGMAKKPGHLTCEVSYHSGPAASGRQFQMQLILQNQTTHREWSLPTQTPIIGGQSGGGSFLTPLPPGLPAGPYRLFPRLLENSHPISTGQGIPLDLPLPDA